MSYQADRNRIPRVVGSSFFLCLSFNGIMLVSREQNISPLLGLVIFSAFLLVSAILMTTIISRLYLQHEIRRLKFDLGNMILLTTLIALPLALSNTLWEIFGLDFVEDIKNHKTAVLLFVTAAGAFLLFPVLFVTEALISWYVLLFRKCE